ncbi:MAG: alpha/beta fold hydrolase [Thermoplasmatota archaeon]
MAPRGVPPIVARELPFERKTVRVDGYDLSVIDEGPRDAETFVFLHGNPTWSFLWRKLLRPARAQGARVIAPDMVGFGFSAKPEDPKYYTVERHVGNLSAVAESLGIRRATWVLHDWGGPVGLGALVRNPSLVGRLVIANTVAFPPQRARALSAWHAFFASAWGSRLEVQFGLAEWSALRFGVQKRLPRDVQQAYRWPMRERGARIAASRFVQMVPNSPDHPVTAFLHRLQAELPKLDIPVAVAWADRDPVMPAKLAEKWKGPFPQADIKHVSPNAGHFWQEDDPEAFLPTILHGALRTTPQP